MKREMRRGLKCRRMGLFNNKIKQRRTKTTPKGKGRQAGRQRTTEQANMKPTRCKTMDQNRTTDTRRLNRETNKGNEGDIGGATEAMIRWKDERGQTIDMGTHGTNNKPCAQHTETTSGGQPGHTSRTVTTSKKYLICGCSQVHGAFLSSNACTTMLLC